MEGCFFIISSFTAPEPVGVSPLSLLWLLPLVAAVVIVYKSLKLEEIKLWNFIKETMILFGSIIIFIVIAVGVLLFLVRFMTG